MPPRPTIMTPTLPDNLTDDDRLLLHLAGELQPPGLAVRESVVLRRLDAMAADPSADPTGRALRDAWAALDGPLAADAAGLSLPSAGIAARAVVRAMNERTPPAVAERRRLRLRPPGWVLYPSAAAAVLALAMVGWWYKVHDEFAQTDKRYRPDPGPPVLVLRGDPGGDLSTQSDEQIAQQFDSMIVGGGGGGGWGGGGGGVEFQFAALEFLEKSIQ